MVAAASTIGAFVRVDPSTEFVSSGQSVDSSSCRGRSFVGRSTLSTHEQTGSRPCVLDLILCLRRLLAWAIARLTSTHQHHTARWPRAAHYVLSNAQSNLNQIERAQSDSKHQGLKPGDLSKPNVFQLDITTSCDCFAVYYTTISRYPQ